MGEIVNRSAVRDAAEASDRENHLVASEETETAFVNGFITGVEDKLGHRVRKMVPGLFASGYLKGYHWKPSSL